MMDPTDDFQFKPLTDGLGFHNKKKTAAKISSLNSHGSLAQEATQAANDAFNDLLTTKTASLDMLESPLPRQESGKSASLKASLSREFNSEGEITPTNFRKKDSKTSVDDILKTLRDRRKLTIKDEKKSLRTPQIENWKGSSWELPAFLLDAMLWTAILLTATLGLLVATKIDLMHILTADNDRMLYVAIGTMVAGFTWIYLVATRIFMGCTPGEWVFDQRIGRPEQFGSASYQLAIAFRSLIVIATGFVIFPFLSVLLDEDILGKFTGFQLMKKS